MDENNYSTSLIITFYLILFSLQASDLLITKAVQHQKPALK